MRKNGVFQKWPEINLGVPGMIPPPGIVIPAPVMAANQPGIITGKI